MGDVLQFTARKVSAEDFVAQIIREAPCAAIHRNALIDALDPVLGLPAFTLEFTTPRGLTDEQGQVLRREVMRAAQFYAMHAIQPVVTALVVSIIRK